MLDDEGNTDPAEGTSDPERFLQERRHRPSGGLEGGDAQQHAGRHPEPHRTGFLEKLFEQEVPEVYDGLIAPSSGSCASRRTGKVAVESYDDASTVGACVGMKGSRMHGIVRELRNENIDVINYTANDQLLIQRALSPAKIGGSSSTRRAGVRRYT